MARYCVKCGTKNGNNATICSCCGVPLAGDSSGSLSQSSNNQNAKSAVSNSNISAVNKSNPVKKQKPVALRLTDLNQTNQLIAKGSMEEIQCQNDFVYVLEDSSNYSSTEYKVLNSIENKGLLRCKQIRYNGKTALYYMAEQKKSFDVIASTLDAPRFLFVLENLLNQIDMVKSNGFLAETGVDARLNRIFVDMTDGKVYLTYLPVTQRCCSDLMYLEQDLRSDLAYVIRSFANLQSMDMMQIADMMEEPACSFSNLLSVIRQRRMVTNPNSR